MPVVVKSKPASVLCTFEGITALSESFLNLISILLYFSCPTRNQTRTVRVHPTPCHHGRFRCWLDFVFTMRLRLGIPCKVSTLCINIARRYLLETFTDLAGCSSTRFQVELHQRASRAITTP